MILLGGAGVLGLDAVEGGSGEDEEGLVAGASEGEVGGALGDLDGFDEVAFGAVDEDVSGGYVDVALGVGEDGFAALLGKEVGVGEGAVGRDGGGVGLLLGLVGDVERLTGGGAVEAEGTENVCHLGAVVEGSGGEVLTRGDEDGAVGGDVVKAAR